MHIKSSTVQVKAGPADGLSDGQFLVYPSTFTRTPDSYGDIVARGAFAESIKHWADSGNVLPGLFGHRMDDPDFYVAWATEMGEDDHGWWVKGEFDLESPKGAQVYRLVKGRRLNQLSFAYDVLDEGSVEIEGGKTANELRKVHVHEFSFVPVGANQDTSVVAVKALADATADAVKQGRVLAAKHIDSLRAAQEAISSVIEAADGSNLDESKASGHTEAKGEEPATVKPEEPRVNPSVEAKSAINEFYLSRMGREIPERSHHGYEAH